MVSSRQTEKLSGKEEYIMSLGTNIQFYRKQKNMTQEDLAELMNVSRQTVSKWESDTAFPETDKLITLSDYFGCTLDELIKGSAEENFTEDAAGYDKEMNSFTRAICLGTATVLAGVTTLLFTVVLGLDETIAAAIFMLFVTVGTAIFIVSGIRHDNYVKENPNIKPFYSVEQIKAFRNKFPAVIAGGTVLVLFGVIALMVMQSFVGKIAPDVMTEESFDALCAAVLLLCVTVAAPMFIYGGMQYAKYDIEEYNKENNPDKPFADRLMSAISSGIMLAATIVLFVMGFCFDNWELCWIGYPIGGVLIAIVICISNAVKK